MPDKEQTLKHHYISRELTDKDIDAFLAISAKKSPTQILINGLLTAFLFFFFILLVRSHIDFTNLFHDNLFFLFKAILLLLQFIILHPLTIPVIILLMSLSELTYNLIIDTTNQSTRKATASILLNEFVKEAHKKGAFCEAIGQSGIVIQTSPISYDDDYLDEMASLLTNTAKSYPASIPLITFIMNCIRSRIKGEREKGIIYAEVVMDQLELGNENILYPDTPNLSNYIFYEHDLYNITKKIEEFKETF